MKRLLFFLCLSITLSSCIDLFITEKDQNRYVNGWIYDYMSAVYYWTSDLPTYKGSNNSPEKYFATLLNPEDRF